MHWVKEETREVQVVFDNFTFQLDQTEQIINAVSSVDEFGVRL